MTDTTELPAPIAAFLETTNRGRTEEFLALFTEDATVTDWDRTVRGPGGIRSWNLTDNIGVTTRYRVLEARPDEGDGYRLDVVATGKGFQGRAVLIFRLSGDRIAALTIPEPSDAPA